MSESGDELAFEAVPVLEAAPATIRGPSPAPGLLLPQGSSMESFRAIVVPNGSSNRLTYTLSGWDYFELASVSADVKTFGAAGDVRVTLELQNASGQTFIKNATGAKIAQFSNGEVTFARYLPDTSTLPGPTSQAILQTGAPIIVMTPGDRISVAADDAGARVVQVRLWVWDARGDIRVPPPPLPLRMRAV